MWNRTVLHENKDQVRHSLSLGLALVLALSLFLALGLDLVQAADENYVVQRGDNLTSIAARFGLTVEALAKANGIVNVNNIYAGQSLKIPGATGANSNNSPTPATTGEQAYLVQHGDTLTSVAARFNISIPELANANGLSVMSYLYVGQTLRIPTKAASPTTPTPVDTGATLAPIVAPTATAIPPTSTPVPPATATAGATLATGNVYTVQSGDNLSAIAARYNTTVAAIQQANNLVNPNSIFAGQKLTIPGPGAVVVKPTVAPAANQPEAVSTSTETGKWIDVNLSQQKMTAYEGNKAVFSTLVSTGVARYPTVTGTFNIYVKYTSQAMTGGSGRDYYYLPGVPYVMYFYGSYGLHGTYWHNNFGHPMSHGCVNLPTPAAKFMYGWAPVGTPVKVHY